MIKTMHWGHFLMRHNPPKCPTTIGLTAYPQCGECGTHPLKCDAKWSFHFASIIASAVRTQSTIIICIFATEVPYVPEQSYIRV